MALDCYTYDVVRAVEIPVETVEDARPGDFLGEGTSR